MNLRIGPMPQYDLIILFTTFTAMIQANVWTHLDLQHKAIMILEG